MVNDALYRRAEMSDIRTVHAVFYRSLYDYLFRTGMIDESSARNPPIETGWLRHSIWFEYLWNSAAENWVAEDAERRVIGWALSILRDGHLELTHCFVDPAIQAKGVGRELVRRAFPDGLGHQKAIIATQDPRAMAIYLRSGVHFVTTSLEFSMSPQEIELSTDLEFELVDAEDSSDRDAIASLEMAVLGYRRDCDMSFLLQSRPAWLARRNGTVVGFAFGAQPKLTGSDDLPLACGPVAAFDTAELPAILDYVMNAAAARKEGRIRFAVPLVNRTAVAHLLGRGAKIDPFYVSILASEDSMRLDRWIHTTPLFII